ncbi:MAG: hypothetical protein MHMPM18_003986 [Marteilia pararefringens]
MAGFIPPIALIIYLMSLCRSIDVDGCVELDLQQDDLKNYGIIVGDKNSKSATSDYIAIALIVLVYSCLFLLYCGACFPKYNAFRVLCCCCTDRILKED